MKSFLSLKERLKDGYKMKLIKDLKEIDKKEILIAGGKGASLGELIKIGMPVPPGFVILARAFEEFLEKTDKIFNFIFWKRPKEKIPKEILNLVKQREKYRKDYDHG